MDGKCLNQYCPMLNVCLRFVRPCADGKCHCGKDYKDECNEGNNFVMLEPRPLVPCTYCGSEITSGKFMDYVCTECRGKGLK